MRVTLSTAFFKYLSASAGPAGSEVGLERGARTHRDNKRRGRRGRLEPTHSITTSTTVHLLIPSMRILMKRICIAFKGLLSPKNVLRVISVSAAHAVLSWKDKKFWMLWKIDFPGQKG